MHFVKAHAHGNDFLYVEAAALQGMPVTLHERLAREICHRHTGVGADGLIVYSRTADGAEMTLFNADGSRAEVSGNGVRALGAILLRADSRRDQALTIQTEAGPKRLTRIDRSASRQTFRAAMGLPRDLRRTSLTAGGEILDVVVMDIGNPQCVVLGELPGPERFGRLGAAIERHEMFTQGTNVEFAEILAGERVRILIWERGVGPTQSSGTGSCAALVAAAAFGGGSRSADVLAPGGSQRVEWLEDSVYLTGWAEIVCDGEWCMPLPT
jgi:diaminopimelate epimerase